MNPHPLSAKQQLLSLIENLYEDVRAIERREVGEVYKMVDAIEAEAASPAALDVTRAIEEICGDLSHYDLSDDPGYIKVPTERVIAILCARLTEQEDRHD